MEILENEWQICINILPSIEIEGVEETKYLPHLKKKNPF